MVLFPENSKEEVNKLIQDGFPYSRVTLQPVLYKGGHYYSVKSSNLDLVMEISKRYRINDDPVIKSL